MKWSITAFCLSFLPFTTLIPVFLKITLPGTLQLGWTIWNNICLLTGWSLSMICIRKRNGSLRLNWMSMIVSSLLLLLEMGMIATAVFIHLHG